MEMASFLAGEVWSEEPDCVSPVLAQVCISGNDEMDQEVRDRLQLYVPRLIGTKSDDHEKARAEHLLNTLIHHYVPQLCLTLGHIDTAATLSRAEGDWDAKWTTIDECFAAREGRRTGSIECKVFEKLKLACFEIGDANFFEAGREAGKCFELIFATLPWDNYFKLLDELIELGPHGENELAPDVAARVPKLKEVLAA